MGKPNKNQQKQRKKEQQQWEREDARVKAFWQAAPHYKRLLRAKGCVLPFYDLLDSYEKEFHSIAAEALSAHSSLLGIHEVEDDVFNARQSWTTLGYEGLTLVDWEVELDDYNNHDATANMRGIARAFLDQNDQLRTLIMIPRALKLDLKHREAKYHMKVITLLHEIGHVDDIERAINFDPATKKAELLKAEIYAHIFCLEQLRKRALRLSTNTLLSALQKYVGAGDYRDEVATAVLGVDLAPPPDWQSFIDLSSPEDQRILGPKGVQALLAIARL